ncbi:toxin co-regulated pilus biosynthesis Q family protein [Hafnia alvei]|uniref:toxin co-regulated pilus biosynthesis Q family protein n=1 Tax=Hafnia alvei TaxID=569 RepID=UPI002DBE2005|nr:toxin co-regulated pilus biosynthesis Q family protein [Hafnia alvei]MEB7891675.1 toxin co-regulated pilus biosynthesis Q family protein [Hafnia alvei]
MKIIHTSVLLPILLGGCSLSHQKETDVDARQFVDGQIDTQMQRIAEAQKSLQLVSRTTTPQTSPPKQILAPVAASKTSAAPASSSPTLRGLPAIKSLGAPEPYSVVNVHARNLKLDAMLRAIIPSGWTPVISADLKRKFTSPLNLTANDQWPYVLNKLLQQNGWVALIDWSKKQVSVAYWTPAFSASPVGNTSPLPQPEISKLAGSSSGVATQTESARPRNPFSQSRAAQKNALVASPSIKPVTKASPVSVTVPAPKIWRIDAGSMLKDALFNWAAAEKCIAPGVNTWTVVWLTPVNYRVDAPLQFKGDFRTALNSLFTLYGSAKVPLYAGTRSAQCVVSVDDKEIH